MDWPAALLLVLTALFSVLGASTSVTSVNSVNSSVNKAWYPCEGQMLFAWGNSSSLKTYVYYYTCTDPWVCYNVAPWNNDDIRSAWPSTWDMQCDLYE